MDMAHGQWVEQDTHTDTQARCRRGENCRESVGTSLGGPQGSFSVSEMGPQSQHRSRILASAPKAGTARFLSTTKGTASCPFPRISRACRAAQEPRLAGPPSLTAPTSESLRDRSREAGSSLDLLAELEVMIWLDSFPPDLSSLIYKMGTLSASHTGLL